MNIYRYLNIKSKQETRENERLSNDEGVHNNLRKLVVRGLVSVFLGQGARVVISTASTAVLARLLTPSDYGIYAMVLPFSAFASMFTDLGLGQSTVQAKSISNALVSTLFWLGLGLSISVGAVFACISPFIAYFYGEPRLTALALVISGTFIFGGLTIQHNALLTRQMKQGTLAIIGTIGLTVSSIASIIAAYKSMGYWSLAVGGYASGIVSVLGVMIATKWLPGRPERGTGARSALKFGGYLTGFNFVNYFARQADKLIIGKFLGEHDLGIYTRAYSILVAPLSQISAPIGSVAIPTLSRLWGDKKRYEAAYLKFLKMTLALTALPIAICIALPNQVVEVLLGPGWEEAGYILALLTISAPLVPASNSVGWLYVSSGNSRQMFLWGIVSSIIIVSTFIAGALFSLKAISFLYSVSIIFVAIGAVTYAAFCLALKLSDIYKYIFYMLMACAFLIILFGLIKELFN